MATVLRTTSVFLLILAIAGTVHAQNPTVSKPPARPHSATAPVPGAAQTKPGDEGDCVLPVEYDPRYHYNPALDKFLKTLEEHEADARKRILKDLSDNYLGGIIRARFSESTLPGDDGVRTPVPDNELLNFSYSLYRLSLPPAITATAQEKSNLHWLRENVEREIEKRYSGKKFFLTRAVRNGEKDITALDWGSIFSTPTAAREISAIVATDTPFPKLAEEDANSLLYWERYAGEKEHWPTWQKWLDSLGPTERPTDNYRFKHMELVQYAAVREHLLNVFESGSRQRVLQEGKQYVSVQVLNEKLSEGDRAKKLAKERKEYCRFYAPGLDRVELRAKWKTLSDEDRAAVNRLRRIQKLSQFMAERSPKSAYGMPIELREKLQTLPVEALEKLRLLVQAAADKKDHDNVLRLLFEQDAAKLTEADPKKRHAYLFPKGSEHLFERSSTRGSNFLEGLDHVLQRMDRLQWDLIYTEGKPTGCRSVRLIPEMGEEYRFAQSEEIKNWDKLGAPAKQRIFEAVFEALQPRLAEELEKHCQPPKQTPQGKANGFFYLEEDIYKYSPQDLIAYYQVIGLALGWKATPAQIASDILENFPKEKSKLPELKQFREDFAREGKHFQYFTLQVADLTTGKNPTFSKPEDLAKLRQLREKLNAPPSKKLTEAEALERAKQHQYSSISLFDTLKKSPHLLQALDIDEKLQLVRDGSKKVFGAVESPYLGEPEKERPAENQEKIDAHGQPAPPIMVKPPTPLNKKHLEDNIDQAQRILTNLNEKKYPWKDRAELREMFDASLKAAHEKTLTEQFADRKPEEPPKDDELRVVRRLLRNTIAKQREGKWHNFLEGLFSQLNQAELNLFPSEKDKDALVVLREQMLNLKDENFPLAAGILKATLAKDPGLLPAIEVTPEGIRLNRAKMPHFGYLQIPQPNLESEGAPNGPMTADEMAAKEKADKEKGDQAQAEFAKFTKPYREANAALALAFAREVLQPSERFKRTEDITAFFEQAYLEKIGQELKAIEKPQQRLAAVIHLLKEDEVLHRYDQVALADVDKIVSDRLKGIAKKQPQKSGLQELLEPGGLSNITRRLLGGSPPTETPPTPLQKALDIETRLKRTAAAMALDRNSPHTDLYKYVAQDLEREGEQLRQQYFEASKLEIPKRGDEGKEKEHAQRLSTLQIALRHYLQAQEKATNFGYGGQVRKETQLFHSPTVSLTYQIDGKAVQFSKIPVEVLTDTEHSKNPLWYSVPVESMSCDSLRSKDEKFRPFYEMCKSGSFYRELTQEEAKGIRAAYQEARLAQRDGGNAQEILKKDPRILQLYSWHDGAFDHFGTVLPPGRGADFTYVRDERPWRKLAIEHPDILRKIIGNYRRQFERDGLSQAEAEKKNQNYRDFKEFIRKISEFTEEHPPIIELENPGGSKGYRSAPGQLAILEGDKEFESIRNEIPAEILTLPQFTEPLKRGETPPTKEKLLETVRTLMDQHEGRVTMASRYARRFQQDIVAGHTANVESELDRLTERAFAGEDEKAVKARQSLGDLQSYVRFFPDDHPLRKIINKRALPPHLKNPKFSAMLAELPPSAIAQEWMLHDAGFAPEKPTDAELTEIYQRLDLQRKYRNASLTPGAHDPASLRALNTKVPQDRTNSKTGDNLEHIENYGGFGDHPFLIEELIREHALRVVVNEGNPSCKLKGLKLKLEELVSRVDLDYSRLMRAIPIEKGESEETRNIRVLRAQDKALGFFLDAFCIVKTNLEPPGKTTPKLELWKPLADLMGPKPDRECLAKTAVFLEGMVKVIDGRLNGPRNQTAEAGYPYAPDSYFTFCEAMNANRTEADLPSGALKNESKIYDVQRVYREDHLRLKGMLETLKESAGKWLPGPYSTPETILGPQGLMHSRHLHPDIRKKITVDGNSWVVDIPRLEKMVNSLERRRDILKRYKKLGMKSWKDDEYDRYLEGLEIGETLRTDRGVPEQYRHTGNDSAHSFIAWASEKYKVPYGGISVPSLEAIRQLPLPVHDMHEFLTDRRIEPVPYARVKERGTVEETKKAQEEKDAARNKENEIRKKQVEDIAKAIHSPWPDDILRVVMNNDSFREQYGKHLDQTLGERFRELAKKRAANKDTLTELDEENEYQMLRWFTGCEYQQVIEGKLHNQAPSLRGRTANEEGREPRFGGFGADGTPPFKRHCAGGGKNLGGKTFNPNAPLFGEVFNQIPNMSLADREKVRAWASQQLRTIFKLQGVDLAKENELMKAAFEKMSRGENFAQAWGPEGLKPRSNVLAQALVTMLWALDSNDKVAAGDGSRAAQTMAMGLKEVKGAGAVRFDPKVVAAREFALHQKLAAVDGAITDSRPKQKLLEEAIKFAHEHQDKKGGLDALARKRLLELPDGAVEKLNLLRPLLTGPDAKPGDIRLYQTLLEIADPEVIETTFASRGKGAKEYMQRKLLDPMKTREEITKHLTENFGKITSPEILQKLQALAQYEMYNDFGPSMQEALTRGVGGDDPVEGLSKQTLNQAATRLLNELQNAAARKYLKERSDATMTYPSAGQMKMLEEKFRTTPQPTAEWGRGGSGPVIAFDRMRHILANRHLFLSKDQLADRRLEIENDLKNANLSPADISNLKSTLVLVKEIESLKDSDPDLHEKVMTLGRFLIPGLAEGHLARLPAEAAEEISQRAADRGHRLLQVTENELLRDFAVAKSDINGAKTPTSDEVTKDRMWEVWQSVLKMRQELIDKAIDGSVNADEKQACLSVDLNAAGKTEWKAFQDRYEKAVYDRNILRSQALEQLRDAIGHRNMLQERRDFAFLPIMNNPKSVAEQKKYAQKEIDSLNTQITQTEKRVQNFRNVFADLLKTDESLDESWRRDYQIEKQKELVRRKKVVDCLFERKLGPNRAALLDLKATSIKQLLDEELAKPEVDPAKIAALMLKGKEANGISEVGVLRQDFIELFAHKLMNRDWQNVDTSVMHEEAVHELAGYFEERTRIRETADAAADLTPGSLGKNWKDTKMPEMAPELFDNSTGPDARFGVFTRAERDRILEKEFKRKVAERAKRTELEGRLAAVNLRVDGDHLNYQDVDFTKVPEATLKQLFIDAKTLLPKKALDDHNAISFAENPWDEFQQELRQRHFESRPVFNHAALRDPDNENYRQAVRSDLATVNTESKFQLGNKSIVHAEYNPKTSTYDFKFKDSRAQQIKATEDLRVILDRIEGMKKCFLDLRVIENSYVMKSLEAMQASNNSEQQRKTCKYDQLSLKRQIADFERAYGAILIDSKASYLLGFELDPVTGKYKEKHEKLSWEIKNATTGEKEQKFPKDPKEKTDHRGYQPALSIAKHLAWQLEHETLLDAQKTITQIDEDHEAMVREAVVSAVIIAAAALQPYMLPEATMLATALSGARLAVAMHWLHEAAHEASVPGALEGQRHTGLWKFIYSDPEHVHASFHTDKEMELYKSIFTFVVQGFAAQQLNAMLGTEKLLMKTLPAKLPKNYTFGQWLKHKAHSAAFTMANGAPGAAVGVGSMHTSSVMSEIIAFRLKEGRMPTQSEITKMHINAIGTDMFAVGLDKGVASFLGGGKLRKFLSAFTMNEGLKGTSIALQLSVENEEKRSMLRDIDQRLRQAKDDSVRKGLQEEYDELQRDLEQSDTLQKFAMKVVDKHISGGLSSTLTHGYFASHAIHAKNNTRGRAGVLEMGGGRRGKAEAGELAPDSYEAWRREAAKESGANPTAKEALRQVEEIEAKYYLTQEGARTERKSLFENAETFNRDMEIRKKALDYLDKHAGKYISENLNLEELYTLHDRAMSPEVNLGLGGEPGVGRVKAEAQKAFNQLAEKIGVTPEVLSEGIKAQRQRLRARTGQAASTPEETLERMRAAELPELSEAELAERMKELEDAVETDRVAGKAAGKALPRKGKSWRPSLPSSPGKMLSNLRGELQPDGTRLIRTWSDGANIQQAMPELLRELGKSLGAEVGRHEVGSPEFLTSLEQLAKVERQLAEFDSHENSRFIKFEIPMVSELPGFPKPKLEMRKGFEPSWYERYPIEAYAKSETLLEEAAYATARKEKVDPKRFSKFAGNYYDVSDPKGRGAHTMGEIVRAYREAEAGGVEILTDMYRRGFSAEFMREMYGNARYDEMLRQVANERKHNPTKLREMISDPNVNLVVLHQKSQTDIDIEQRRQAAEKLTLDDLALATYGHPATETTRELKPRLKPGTPEYGYWVGPLAQAQRIPNDVFHRAVENLLRKPEAEQMMQMPLSEVMPAIRAEAAAIMANELSVRVSAPRAERSTPEAVKRRTDLSAGLIHATQGASDVPVVGGVPVGDFNSVDGNRVIGIISKALGISDKKQAPGGMTNIPKSSWESQSDRFKKHVATHALNQPELSIREVSARFMTNEKLGYRDPKPGSKPAGGPLTDAEKAGVEEFRSQTGYGNERFDGSSEAANRAFEEAYYAWQHGRVVQEIKRGDEVVGYKLVEGPQPSSPAMINSRSAMERFHKYFDYLREQADFTAEKFGSVGAARAAFALYYDRFRYSSRKLVFVDGKVVVKPLSIEETNARGEGLLAASPEAALDMSFDFEMHETFRRRAGFTAEEFGTETAARAAFAHYQNEYYRGATPPGRAKQAKTQEAIGSRPDQTITKQAENIKALYLADPARAARKVAAPPPPPKPRTPADQEWEQYRYNGNTLKKASGEIQKRVTKLRAETKLNAESFGAAKEADRSFELGLQLWELGFSVTEAPGGGLGLTRTSESRRGRPLPEAREFLGNFRSLMDSLRDKANLGPDQFGNDQAASWRAFLTAQEQFLGGVVVTFRQSSDNYQKRTPSRKRATGDEFGERISILSSSPEKAAAAFRETFEATEWLRVKSGFTADQFGGNENAAREAYAFYEGKYLEGWKVTGIGAKQKWVLDKEDTPEHRLGQHFTTINSQVRLLRQIEPNKWKE